MLSPKTLKKLLEREEIKNESVYELSDNSVYGFLFKDRISEERQEKDCEDHFKITEVNESQEGNNVETLMVKNNSSEFLVNSAPILLSNNDVSCNGDICSINIENTLDENDYCNICNESAVNINNFLNDNNHCDACDSQKQQLILSDDEQAQQHLIKNIVQVFRFQFFHKTLIYKEKRKKEFSAM